MFSIERLLSTVRCTPGGREEPVPLPSEGESKKGDVIGIDTFVECDKDSIELSGDGKFTRHLRAVVFKQEQIITSRGVIASCVRRLGKQRQRS